MRAHVLTGEEVASDVVRRVVAATIDVALSTFGRYHAVPVVDRLGAKLRVRDANLLFYYRNRLDGVLHEVA